jgi:hypothetical protein
MSQRFYRRQAIFNTWRNIVESGHVVGLDRVFFALQEMVTEEDRIWVIRQMEAWWMQ